MLDTMFWTKVVGGLCGTWLVFLLGALVAESIYHQGGHGYDHHQAYTIDTGDDGAEEEVVEVPFAEVFAAADAGAGERLFRQCAACHKVEDGANGAGPHLFGVVGRDVQSVGGFNYSGNLLAAADVWTPENLNAFLAGPSNFASGTSMNYRGMPDIEDRANLIAWLESVGN
ncbi:MAG: c-type cytochrome [Paracoccaceae bacterium]|nr:c-type cytochrome [Paracoccaceae bacterium]